MSDTLIRAEILAKGFVQGVGFRYFVLRNAVKLGLKGYVQNLVSEDEVLTVVEGEKYLIEDLFKEVRIGPTYSSVKKCTIGWKEYKGEFDTFDVRD
ncbi:MAG: acylphosphatase [Ignavibacteriales bacterium]|nr:MAG: acylphosphatase [Ignavibacteriales bacterium]